MTYDEYIAAYWDFYWSLQNLTRQVASGIVGINAIATAKDPVDIALSRVRCLEVLLDQYKAFKAEAKTKGWDVRSESCL
jgi:hypothetical protein